MTIWGANVQSAKYAASLQVSSKMKRIRQPHRLQRSSHASRFLLLLILMHIEGQILILLTSKRGVVAVATNATVRPAKRKLKPRRLRQTYWPALLAILAAQSPATVLHAEMTATVQIAERKPKPRSNL